MSPGVRILSSRVLTQHGELANDPVHGYAKFDWIIRKVGKTAGIHGLRALPGLLPKYEQQGCGNQYDRDFWKLHGAFSIR